jgi:hypothetical protein
VRRSIIAAVAAALTAALTFIAAAPAHADTLPIQPVFDHGLAIGALDSLSFQSDGGIIATGWSIHTQNPAGDGSPNEVQMLSPDGHAFWGIIYGGDRALPRADVAAAHPEAGPNHGYRLSLGFPLGIGRWEVCMEAEYEIVGCGYVDVTPEIVTGQIESVTADDSSGTPKLRVRGWVSDSWSSENNSISLTATSDTGTTQDWFAYATIDRPDIRASHPGVAGIKGFEATIPVGTSSIYSVCGTVDPGYRIPGNNPADIDCLNGAAAQIRQTVAPVLGGAPTLGSTLTYTPASWQPAAATDRITWTGAHGDQRAGSLTYPITPADVGTT